LPTARIDGIDLAYEVAGTGPRVLFLNGSGGTMAQSRPLLGLVGDGVELLAFDQRGLGASGPAPAPYDMARCAADALGLLDAVGWDTAVVLGVSFGGMVAQELAVTAPGRVERLALLCTSPGGAGGSSYPLHELDGMAPEQLAEIRRTLLDSRFDEAWLEGHPGDRRLIEMMTSADVVEEPAVTAGRRAQMAARRGHDVWDRLGAIACPAFVGCGRYDPIAPLVNSEAIVSRIPDAELHIYEGGHPFFVQDPKALPEIRKFLLGPGR